MYISGETIFFSVMAAGVWGFLFWDSWRLGKKNKQAIQNWRNGKQ